MMPSYAMVHYVQKDVTPSPAQGWSAGEATAAYHGGRCPRRRQLRHLRLPRDRNVQNLRKGKYFLPLVLQFHLFFL